MNIFDLFKREIVYTVSPYVLIIYDGWGVAEMSQGNAIAQAKTPNYNFYLENYPHSVLIASGESVGLPANIVGNSEVGHLTIGAGRVVYESLVRINHAIEDGSFYNNQAFIETLSHIKKNNSKLHLMGMASLGNVHSSIKHLYALIEFAESHNVKTVLHLFTDGRDAPTNDGINVIKDLETRLSSNPNIYIGSIAGRFYAMDRDSRWERVAEVYNNIILGTGATDTSASKAIEMSYKAGISDEFIKPTTINNGNNDPLIRNGDAVVSFNFRADRARELAMSFVLPESATFKHTKIAQDLYFVSMTEYEKGLPVTNVAFPPQNVPLSLSELFSNLKIPQLHLAESEKEKMVTYYFDGLKTKPFEGEDVTIVSSAKVKTYDKKPEMSVFDIVKSFKTAMRQNKYKFFVINIANPDMVAHTGKLEATIKAIEKVDKATGEIVDEVYRANGTVFITADHGNAEELITYNQSNFFFTSEEGSMNTEHSNNPVPFIIMNRALLGKTKSLRNGALSDVAVTLLSLMGIKVPEQMTGKNLLSLDKI